MLWLLLGIAIGLVLGWFSYNYEPVFVGVCSALAITLLAIFSRSWVLVAAAERYNPSESSVVLQLILKIPSDFWTMLSASLIFGVVIRMYMHVKKRCFSSELVPEDREERRQRIRSEMKLLDQTFD